MTGEKTGLPLFISRGVNSQRVADAVLFCGRQAM